MKPFLFLVLISIPHLLFASSIGQFSMDCQSWKNAGSAESAQAGYLKNESGTIYFDFSKNLWIQLEAEPFIFLEKNKEVFILTGSTIESHTLKNKYKDTILKLALVLADIAKKTTSEPRWTLRMKNGEGELSAMLMGPKKCSVEPNALGLVCKKEKACILGPNVQNPEKNVQFCAKELGLLENDKLQAINRACEIILDETIYKSIQQSYDDVSSACKLKVSKFPSLLQLRKTCEDGSTLIRRF